MLFTSEAVPAVAINLVVGVLIYKIVNITVQKAVLNF